MTHNNIAFLFDKVLSNDTIEIIRNESKKIEAQRKLTPSVLALIYESKWLKIMEPKTCDGLEWTLPKIVRLFEALSYADGNVGWCVNLGAGANLFSGYFPEEKTKEIFSSKYTWCAGSGAATGTAKKVKNGYNITGKWKYASGSAHATHFTANCYLQDATGNPILEDGIPAFRSFIFPAKEVTVFDTWNVLGLNGTASNDFEVSELFVPDSEVFSLVKPSTFAEASIFHFPFEVMAFVNMACMSTGMAFHFMELVGKLLTTKIPLYSRKKLEKMTLAQSTYNECLEKLTAARNQMYLTLEQVWEPYEKGEQAMTEDLKRLIDHSREASDVAKEIAFQLFPLCGMTVLFNENELNKVWRDLTVAGQHYLLSPLYSEA